MSLPVLICDDSGFARKQMAKALPTAWDVDIGFAANGREAIEGIKAGKADVLFLDLNMPELDGVGVLKQIREEDLPTMTIVVSGDIQDGTREKVMQLGALDFIQKPTDQNKISSILKQYGIYSGPETSNREIKIDVDIFDCYREVANVAMGRAADMLGKLLGKQVILGIPKVDMLDISELHLALQYVDQSDTYSAVCQGFMGEGISGEAMLLARDSIFKDVAVLMGAGEEVNDAMETECLIDISNILIGACLKGIAEQLDLSFSQGHPVILGQHCKISDLLKAPSNWEETLAIEIGYKIENHDIDSDLLLLFTNDTVPLLNKKISGLL